ncbi:MAG: hypothetical protein F4065_01445 [Rhodothermaceae bacterium]|nr:hypothetical protein [Rhodothermaceae bacterium]MXX96171.1 hypothetical protein [Rhodothermaceae bacterium]MXZ58960.1 hypothetical protein [Rhodothermaceae bacterium]MYE63457.1 hypothetical protein [Rhodothermaceae bacterium]MYH11559.1 hypothetical protein [Rhodothermaceae bacterium]
MREWTIKRLRFKRVSEPLNQLEQLFKTAYEEFFKDGKVELIRIREPLPFDDPDYLDIAFVYSSPKERNYREAMDFFNHVRLKLEELNDERFPVMSFIDYDDYLENTPKELMV